MVAAEFAALKERAASLFEGLRDLPPYGQALWESYFHRTFDVHNKLWKLQQERRAELEEQCGLQRHQIGETASRIGQLYYQFYLRKGDNCYLDEAFVFYSAIRSRHYFALKTAKARQALSEEERQQLELRQLRYYARFAMVCLLLGKHALLRELLAELRGLVKLCAPKLTEADLQTWQLVQREFEAFVTATQPLTILPLEGTASKDNAAERPSLRLRAHCVEAQAALLDAIQPASLSLAQAVLVCTVPAQLKVSEMPIDMYRMAHALEWDSVDLKAASEAQARGEPSKVCNPVKYMLHRAMFSQLALVLSTALGELGRAEALLLYISADAWRPVPREESSPPPAAAPMDGVALATTDTGAVAVHSSCLCAADLRPFRRMPLFLVVESSNSQAFASLGGSPNDFLLPTVCLLAPCPNPAESIDQQLKLAPRTQLGNGGALTLFLHDPLSAFCALSGVKVTSTITHAKCENLMLKSFTELTSLLIHCADTPPALLAFLRDPFTRTLLLRYVLCLSAFRLHKQMQNLFATDKLLPPRCEPPIPAAVTESGIVLKMVRQLAASFGAVDEFHTQIASSAPAATSV
ncbi:hypothetical protein AB1Y20_010895 [Prymnesium parvum]|uniref:Protein SCAI n=1 Tax=Prymnesium parvum TaxID=97485 RepID=A0AB34IU33_PRYPA